MSYSTAGSMTTNLAPFVRPPGRGLYPHPAVIVVHQRFYQVEAKASSDGFYPLWNLTNSRPFRLSGMPGPLSATLVMQYALLSSMTLFMLMSMVRGPEECSIALPMMFENTSVSRSLAITKQS